MYLKLASVTKHRKAWLAIRLVLMAAVFAAGSAQAQNRGKTETWKSHLSADAPDVIYRTHCAACHGVNGDGKSLARYSFDPPPADFTSNETRAELSRVHMIETLNKGARDKQGKQTGMMAWKSHLSRAQIEAVVDYVIVKFMDGKVAANELSPSAGLKHKGHDHSAANVIAVDYPYGLKASAANGKSIYAANCAQCHGDSGDGRGKPERVGQSHPRNFQDADFRQFASGFSLFSAVSRGRGHMPAWDKTLSNQEIADVSEYVLRNFAKPHSH